MPSNLSEYVASRYLVADPKPSTKKRKRKHDKSSASGLIIQDDDDWGATSSSTRKSKHHGDDGDNDENTPVTVGTVKQVRKTTKANWKSLSGDDNSAAADAILASAAAENEASRHADDDDPTVVTTSSSTARMTDGSHAGLQSAAAVTAQLARRAREEREQFEAEKALAAAAGTAAMTQETFYRDATGRRVDVSEKRAEARRAAAAAEDEARKRKEALRGEVQVREAEARRAALEEAKGMDFARRADDVEMNDELRGQLRWNDPMAKFLEAEETTGWGMGGKGKGPAAGAGGRSSRRPVYKGACPPNRYGIKPGYRWDGVDRGNGFEAERFKALNRRERNKDLSYQWQMDE